MTKSDEKLLNEFLWSLVRRDIFESDGVTMKYIRYFINKTGVSN